MRTLKIAISLAIGLAGATMMMAGLEDESFSTGAQLMQDGGAILATAGFLGCYSMSNKQPKTEKEDD